VTETRTKIREVFVNISSLLFVSRSWLIAKMHVFTDQLTAVRTAYCVIASNSVFSNIVSSRLLLSVE